MYILIQLHVEQYCPSIHACAVSQNTDQPSLELRPSCQKVKAHTQSLYVYILLKHTWTHIYTSILLLIVSSSQPASPGSSSNPQT